MGFVRITVAAFAAAALAVGAATPASATPASIAKCAVGKKSTGTAQGILVPTRAETHELFGECGTVFARVRYTLGPSASAVYLSAWRWDPKHALSSSYPATVIGEHRADRSASFQSFH